MTADQDPDPIITDPCPMTNNPEPMTTDPDPTRGVKVGLDMNHSANPSIHPSRGGLAKEKTFYCIF